MKEALQQAVREALTTLGTPGSTFEIVRPPLSAGAAYATNAALIAAKSLGRVPQEVAEELPQEHQPRLIDARKDLPSSTPPPHLPSKSEDVHYLFIYLK